MPARQALGAGDLSWALKRGAGRSPLLSHGQREAGEGGNRARGFAALTAGAVEADAVSALIPAQERNRYENPCRCTAATACHSDRQGAETT